MKLEVTVRKTHYVQDEYSKATVWIVDLDNGNQDDIFSGEGSTPGEAFEQALLKLCFEVTE